MRKLSLIFVIISIMCLISGCSNDGSKLPYSRKQDIKNDKIKFYNFNWLTEINDIFETFDKDFGKDTYTYTVKTQIIKVNDGTEIEKDVFEIKGKDGGDLLWEIAEHKLQMMYIECISNDNGKHKYIDSGTYVFKEKDDETKKDIKNKLDTLYTYDKDDLCYKDMNGNTIQHFTNWIMYDCTEVVDYVNDLHIKQFEEKTYNESNLNGL